MAIYNASLLISASNATYFTNVTGGIAAVAVRDFNDTWISSSALLTGSNTFNGNQTINGDLTVHTNVVNTFDGANQFGQIYSLGNIGLQTNQGIGWTNGPAITTSGSELTISASANHISGNVDINGTFTASLQTGYLYVGDGNGRTQAVATSSIVTNINTGSFATTGSNVFTGLQTLNAPSRYGTSVIDIVSSSINFAGVGSRINFPNGGYFLGNPGDLMQFTTDGVGQQFLTGDSGGAPSARNITFRNTSPNGNIQLTAENGGNVSFSGSATYLQGLRYPLADGTSGQAIVTDGSGHLSFGNVSINTGSFATTGSNTFYGNQSILGDISLLSGSTLGKITFPNNSQLSGIYGDQFKFSANETSTQFLINSSSSPLNMIFENRGNNGQTQFLNILGSEFHSASSYTFNGGNATFQGNIYAANLTGSSIDTGSFLLTGSATLTQNAFGHFNYNVQTGNDGIAIRLFNTGSDASGSMEFGVTDPGNPFIQLKKKNWFQIQGNEDLNYINFTASFDNGASVGPNFGSRTMMLTTSGSLGLFNPNTQRARVMTNILANTTANNGVNLAFNTNTNTNTTIISGSNNIYVNPAAPTAGFTRFVGSNGNIALNASNVAQISSSMAFPITMNNNIFTGNGFPLNMRGPVSSSAWTIAGNVIQGNAQIGSNATNNAEKLIAGLQMNNNYIAGGLSYIANKTNLTQVQVISANLSLGSMTVNANSSSTIHSQNIANGSLTVNNNFYTTNPTAITNQGNNISVFRNVTAGIGHIMNFSGSGILATNGLTPTIQDNVVVGSTNTLFAGADIANNNSALQSTAIIGFNLIVTGSSDIITATDIGSGFIGRYNAVDGNKAKSSQTIFAVGTGTSGSAGISRKTGFLIDSGSNSYFEGSLNVSGSSAMTGSIAVTGNQTLQSYTILSNVSASLNFADDTAAAAGGVPLGGLYRNGNFVMIRLT